MGERGGGTGYGAGLGRAPAGGAGRGLVGRGEVGVEEGVRGEFSEGLRGEGEGGGGG